MKFKHTLLLLLLASGLAAYVWFVDRKMPTTHEREDRKGRLFEFERGQISAIAIKTPEAKIDLKKDGQNWKVESPVKDRADSVTMSALLTSIELVRSESTIGNDGKGVTREQLKEFGLADPATKITLTVEGKSVELLIGKDTAIENRVYAMIEDSKTVEVISSNLRNEISKKADDFRDKRLSDLSIAQIRKAVFKTPAGEIEVEKTNDHWSLVRPLKARGDDGKIGDTISEALTARVESFVADTSKLGEYGLEQPRGTVTLTVEGQEQPQVITLGGNPKDEKEKNKVYARLSSRDAVVLLPKSVESLLELKPNDLRDRKLVQFNSDMVDRITLEPAGQEKLVLARKGEQGWVRKADKDYDVNGMMVTRLLDELSSAMVTNFVADVATDLPAYGLDQPTVKVTLSAFSSENTAETAAGEKPIVTVLFGKEKDADMYAKLDDEPFVLSTPNRMMDAIVTDPIKFQPVEVYKNKAEDIVWFEIVREGSPTLVLERDKDKNWKLAKGDDKVNTVNVESLVNTLANLRAVRWDGAVTADHGVDKKIVVVTFKTAGNTTGKLTIGGTLQDDMRYAIADGTMGTFVMTKPDFDAFASSLLDNPLTTPTPATPTPGGTAPTPTAPEAAPATSAPPPPAPMPAEAVDPAKPKPSEAPAQPPQKP